MNNNPVRYNDPSGHKACNGAGIGGKCDQAKADDLLRFYGITASGITERSKWELADAATYADIKLANAGYGSFRRIHGEVTVTGVGLARDNCETIGSTITCGSAAQYMTAFLHELGHAAENHLATVFGRRASDLDSYKDSEGHLIDDEGGYWIRTTYGFKCDGWDCLEHPPALDVDQTSGYAKAEQWADLYMNWVLDGTGDDFHGFTNDSYGNARRNYMSEQFYWIFTGSTLP
jgi:hypothetical protein